MKYPKMVLVEAVLMGNGEVISRGKTLGFIGKTQWELIESGASKMARGNEDIIWLQTEEGDDSVA